MTLDPTITDASVRRPARRWRLAIGSLLLGLLAACTRPEPAAPPALPTVGGGAIVFPQQKSPAELRLALVEPDSDRPLEVPGRLAWDEDQTARIYAPFGGRIERLRVALGDTVQAGQALAEVSASEIGQAQADLHKAQADETLARAAVERARELAEAGVIARKDLQQAEADQARNLAELGRSRARLAQYGVSAGSVTQHLTLSSPLRGKVVERNVNAKAEVRSDLQGPPLLTISNPASLWAQLDVDEKEIAAFRPGQPVTLRAAAWPERGFAATVTSISDAVDASSRTVKVRLKVANAEGLLKAEMFVTASVSRPSPLPTVPADAVLLKGDKLYAFVQSAPGRFERREIQARSGGPQSWRVSKGLVAGEQVVVGGALFLDQMLDARR
ncbi:MAG: efflux RND transporter periplasmic adaptor subunit [Rubrivivax sp.]|nr:efflux RND transporter periplasmic adaptor subunit [Rubrivivax sp.]